MSATYRRRFNRAPAIFMDVDFKTVRRDVVDYSIVLLAEVDGKLETIRVYDGAHGKNELHRYTPNGGKQPGEAVHDGALGKGMRTAINDIKRGYGAMIEAWRKH